MDKLAEQTAIIGPFFMPHCVTESVILGNNTNDEKKLGSGITRLESKLANISGKKILLDILCTLYVYHVCNVYW